MLKVFVYSAWLRLEDILVCWPELQFQQVPVVPADRTWAKVISCAWQRAVWTKGNICHHRRTPNLCGQQCRKCQGTCAH